MLTMFEVVALMLIFHLLRFGTLGGVLRPETAARVEIFDPAGHFRPFLAIFGRFWPKYLPAFLVTFHPFMIIFGHIDHILALLTTFQYMFP